VIFGMRRKKIKEICKKKGFFGLGRRGSVEGFQTSTCLEGYKGCLYLVHDIEVLHAMIIVRCREPKQRDS
jgi:hypothetical protein